MPMNINHKSHSVFKGYETYEVFMTTRRGVLNVTGFTELNIESNPKSPSHQLHC